MEKGREGKGGLVYREESIYRFKSNTTYFCIRVFLLQAVVFLFLLKNYCSLHPRSISKFNPFFQICLSSIDIYHLHGSSLQLNILCWIRNSVIGQSIFLYIVSNCEAKNWFKRCKYNIISFSGFSDYCIQKSTSTLCDFVKYSFWLSNLFVS